MTLHEAFQSIARAAGLPSLSVNANDAAELRIENGLVSIYLLAVDEDQIELSMRLESPKAHDGNLRFLLAENGRRQFGRLAVEPGTDHVVFCHRIWLEDLAEAKLLAAFDKFYREAAIVENRANLPDIVHDNSHRPPSPEEFASMIRL